MGRGIKQEGGEETRETKGENWRRKTGRKHKTRSR